MKRLLTLVAAGLAVALLAGSAGASTSSPVQSAGGPGDAVVDAVARVLVVELGDGGGQAERAGIAFVAINRARRWGASVPDVVRSQVPGRPEWGAGCGGQPACDYNGKLDAAGDHPAYARSVALAQRIVDGGVANPIGERRNFLHPNHPTFARDRASGTVAERQQAAELRRRAAGQTGTTAADLYRQANAAERVNERYAWEPTLRRYLPTWSVAREHGGAANHPPMTIGETRFS